MKSSSEDFEKKKKHEKSSFVKVGVFEIAYISQPAT